MGARNPAAHVCLGMALTCHQKRARDWNATLEFTRKGVRVVDSVMHLYLERSTAARKLTSACR
jgi:hypothetical protein